MMNALGINIYGGGFTLGVQKHFKVLGQWEECNLGRRTFDLNFKNIYRPLNLWEWPVNEHKHKVDFLFANPPCRPWSNASVWKGRTKQDMYKDPRLDLTEHTMVAALKIEPDIFISESVENAYNIGKQHYDDIAKRWNKKGYHVTYFLNDAIIQGAPCIRRRFHFIASRYKLQLADNPGKFKVNTVRDAIGDITKFNDLPHHQLGRTRKGFDKIFKFIPEYWTLMKYINARGDDWDGNRANFIIRKLAWDWPAPTMVGFEYIHPLNRWITWREALRLCTYPDTFLAHSAEEAVDAVIPVVAEFLTKVAKKTLISKEPVKPGLSVIDWRPFAKPFHFKKIKS